MSTSILPPASLCLTALLLSGAPASAATVVPLGGKLYLHAATQIGELASPEASDSQVAGQSWITTPADLATSANASVTAPSGSISVGGAVAAHWGSAISGRVEFSDFGWSIAPTGLMTSGSTPYVVGWVGLCGLQCGDTMGAWSYTFTAASDGGFHVTYNITSETTGSGISDGFWGLSGGDYDPAGNTVTIGSGDLTGLQLTAGRTYTVSIFPGWSGGGALYAQSKDFHAVFDWEITDAGIPEPSAWVLMIGGFGLAGATLRRRAYALARSSGG